MRISGSLARYILPDTIEAVFWRGFKYFHDRKVSIYQESDKKLSGFVHGSNVYRVEFRQGPKYVKGYCDCPYFETNDDYCKHIVALAIAYDDLNGVESPDEQEVKSSSLKIDRDFGKKIDEMFEKPLEADLEFLAKISDYTAWNPKPHAKIAVRTYINDINKSLSQEEVVKGFRNLLKAMGRYNFDDYFCAGEVSAALAKTFDVIIKRAKLGKLKEILKIFEFCVVFYYEDYLGSIDGSDGVWKVPYARLPILYKQLISLGAEQDDIVKLRNDLNDYIEGWGDIFEDLGLTSIVMPN